jgi:predicted  nucleic acid-binding Zn-ribbon protein
MIHPDISNGTKTKDQIKTIMENLIVGQIGDSPSGVLGFTDLNRQISIKEKEVQKVTSPLAEFEKKLKGGIWEDISDSYNDAKLKREKKELEDKMKPLEETRDALRMELKALTDKKNQLKESLETRLKRSNLLK